MKHQIVAKSLASLLLASCSLLTQGHIVWASSGLDQSFLHPPDSARPWVYWFWLNGNITSNGITADLEAMKRVGIGGVLIMEVDQGTPKGQADFGGRQWRELFKHVCAEANRLGLEVNMNNDAGWCGSGGPWIKPELAMQKVVWTETNVVGPCHLSASLAHPETVSNYYAEIVVLAFPKPAKDVRIQDIKGKAAFIPERIPSRSKWDTLASENIIPGKSIINLSRQLGTNGALTWDVPSGTWTILRLGHTPTGKDNHPAPEPGRGLECDKLSKKATDTMFDALMGKLISDSKPFAGRTLVSTHIDSWETGSQNWTPNFREEFKKRRGYDPFPFLPVWTGRVVDSLEISERFLWDLRQTVSDLLIENYAARFRERAHQYGLGLSIEAYDGTPCDDMTYAGRADEPMAEFWSWGYNAAYSCTEMASAAHIYGKRILGAEAFTASDGEKWLHHPASIKALGDWAFCEGINRFVFHRYALQPWLDRQPGMSMGPWGLHYERTQTWWEQSKAWHEYLARCQFLLRQGLFVADVCYLQPEGSPQRFTLSLPERSGNTPDRPLYNFDGCTPEVVLTRMKVKDRKLVLPDGMSYRLLVLPQVETMTPTLLGRIKELVQAGATVVGSHPIKSPSLSKYPACDLEINRVVAELWGNPPPLSSNEAIVTRPFGKGRIIFGGECAPTPVKETKNPFAQAKWIWFPEGNPAVAAPVGKRYFRRVFIVENIQSVKSARMIVTADNAFEVWINGKRAGEGDSYNEIYKFDLAQLVTSGTNLIAVAGRNGGEQPNPAGLLACVAIQFANGAKTDLVTDKQWESTDNVANSWFAQRDTSENWKPAMELGAFGMPPWEQVGKPSVPPYSYPAPTALASILKSMSIPPDFETDGHLRYIHRHEKDLDIYFVANPETNWIGTRCIFRVAGKQPELWNPITGEIKQQLIYEQNNGRTVLPIWLEPAGSVFVVFRNSFPRNNAIIALKRDGESILPAQGEPLNQSSPAEPLSVGGKINLLASKPGHYELNLASGPAQQFELTALPEPFQLGGPWEVRFPTNCGAPEKLVFEGLLDWSKHSDPRIKYFSGIATYTKPFVVPDELIAPARRLYLDLGQVAVIAQLKMNGKELGTLWKPPFRVEVTEAVRPGENVLEIEVVNLWPNRLIGDEQLAEDSERKSDGTLKQWPEWLQTDQSSPTGRRTFTTWRLWKKDSPLQESGLLGPVRLIPVQQLGPSAPKQLTKSK